MNQKKRINSLILPQKEKLNQGTVIKSTGSWYKVIDTDKKEWECRIRGKLRMADIKSTNPVAVGDEILFDIETNEEADIGVIKKILPRKNYIVRKSINLSKRSHILAANIDRVYLIVTLVSPQTQTGFIDRFLVTAEAYHIPVTLLFNKIDLYTEKEMNELEHLQAVYEAADYPCRTISARQAASVQFLRDEINGKKVMFGGHSGVGKSTLVNTLDERLNLRTGEISQSHSSGLHTTTFAEMFELASGGYIIDTPGIRAFGLIDFDKRELSHYFPEMRALLPQCKFNDCQHLNEPKCAVKKAFVEDEIAESRYMNYVKMMEEDQEENFRKDIYK